MRWRLRGDGQRERRFRTQPRRWRKLTLEARVSRVAESACRPRRARCWRGRCSPRWPASDGVGALVDRVGDELPGAQAVAALNGGVQSASSCLKRLTAASMATISPGWPALARTASIAVSNLWSSESSSGRRAPSASTICVWAKWVSANALSARCAAMSRGTTPFVTRSCAPWRPWRLTRSTAVIAAVSARIAPKARPSLMDRAHLPSRGMWRGAGRRIPAESARGAPS